MNFAEASGSRSMRRRTIVGRVPQAEVWSPIDPWRSAVVFCAAPEAVIDVAGGAVERSRRRRGGATPASLRRP